MIDLIYLGDSNSLENFIFPPLLVNEALPPFDRVRINLVLNVAVIQAYNLFELPLLILVPLDSHPYPLVFLHFLEAFHLF